MLYPLPEEPQRAGLFHSRLWHDVRVICRALRFDESLHRAVLATRSHYFHTYCSPMWATTSTTESPEIELNLPTPFRTDGDWATTDLMDLFRFFYIDAAGWQKCWCEQTVGDSGRDIQRWLRLHRLARYVQFDALQSAVEHFLMNAVLNRLARQLDSAVVELLLTACSLTEEREGMFTILCAWATTIVPSLTRNRIAGRATMIQYISRLTNDAPLLLTNAFVVTLCHQCFLAHPIERDMLVSPRLGHDQSWQLVRYRGDEWYLVSLHPQRTPGRVIVETLDATHGVEQQELAFPPLPFSSAPVLVNHDAPRYVGCCESCQCIKSVYVFSIDVT